MSTLAQVDSFGIVLPDGWASLPTGLSEFDRFAETARGKRWRTTPGWDPALERRADTMLGRLRYELMEAGVVLAAVYLDHVVDDTADGGAMPEVLMGGCTLGVYTKADLETPLSLSLPVLYSVFTRKPRDERRQLGRISDVTRPELTDLPAGRCVHLRRLYEPRHFGTPLDDYFAETFAFPIGTDGETCCVLQFATTNVDQARPFSELFGGIARTFRMFRPDEPTDFSG